MKCVGVLYVAITVFSTLGSSDSDLKLGVYQPLPVISGNNNFYCATLGG